MAGILDVTGWSTREWDSSFFGVTIGQVTTKSATAEELGETVREADRAAIGCLYFLVDGNDQSAIRAAETTGFSLVDIRVTLDCDLPSGLKAALYDQPDPSPERGPYFVRPARADDTPRLKDLARASHRNTRFYQDPHFDRGRSDELYAIWIERSVAGELADIVWVVDVNGAPCGYLTAKTDGNGGTIGLVAVDAACRGRGYGDALLRAALTWADEGGLSCLSVVTQGRSAAAIRFYQRAGFLTRAVELWYHRWRTPLPGGSHAAAR